MVHGQFRLVTENVAGLTLLLVEGIDQYGDIRRVMIDEVPERPHRPINGSLVVMRDDEPIAATIQEMVSLD